MTKYIVETEFLYGWENVWTDEHGNPTVYDTFEDAEAELTDFIADTREDHKAGFLKEPYDIEQYRIVRVADPDAMINAVKQINKDIREGRA
jgi:hypothetical protein